MEKIRHLTDGGASTSLSERQVDGFKIQMPVFIAPGETLLVDTKTHKYAGKAG